MADWVTYDWHIHEEAALFHVDASYASQTIEALDTLLYCAVSSPEESVAFSASELRKLSRLETKLINALGDACYVGDILMDTVKQLYFYVSADVAPSLIEAVEAIAHGERKLSVSVNTSFEPDWLTYHALLLPDAAKYQTIFNEELIEKQRAVGDALDKIRRISVLMCFATDHDRQMFYEDARHAGFALGDPLFQPELELPHVVTLYALCTLEKTEVDAMTTRAIDAAQRHGGELLRWNCPRMSRRSPLA